MSLVPLGDCAIKGCGLEVSHQRKPALDCAICYTCCVLKTEAMSYLTVSNRTLSGVEYLGLAHKLNFVLKSVSRSGFQLTW